MSIGKKFAIALRSARKPVQRRKLRGYPDIGKTRSPHSAGFLRVFDFFGLSREYLRRGQKTKRKKLTLPVLSGVQSGEKRLPK